MVDVTLATNGKDYKERLALGRAVGALTVSLPSLYSICLSMEEEEILFLVFLENAHSDFPRVLALCNLQSHRDCFSAIMSRQTLFPLFVSSGFVCLWPVS